MSTPNRAVARPLTSALIVALAIALLPGGPAPSARAAVSELFFSEYIEGSSNNKALEVYNGTGSAIDLGAGGYNIQMFFNGNPVSTLTINLTGTVAAGDVHVVAQAAANATILAQADQTNGSGWFNGDDAVVLRKGTTIIDAIGQAGLDPGTEWGSGLTSTADNTLRRKSTIESGDGNASDAFDPSIEWDGLATDTFLGLGAYGDPAPFVLSTIPANGADLVDRTANISVTFWEPVNATGAWFGISCSTSGSHAATVSGGPLTFTLDPDVDFGPGETCTVTVFAAQIADQDGADPPDGMAADRTFSFTTGLVELCGDPFSRIFAIQGSGSDAAITGNVSTEGVVVSDDEGPTPTLRGFYLQDPTGDGDPATSDGIFVFNGDNNTVDLGDNVRVTGTASEFQNQTQISASSVIVCAPTDTVTPTDITFPVPTATHLERYEGMLIRVPQVMTVTEHFQLGRFNQVVLSSDGRLDNPTAVVAPGAPAVALQSANNLRKIILDDSSQAQNPDPIIWARGGAPLSASNTLRGGDTAAGIVGVMTFTWAGNAASGNAYRIRPVNALGGSAQFVAVNQRPGEAVELDGGVRVAALNLLNYFNTFDGLPDTVNNCTNGVGGVATDCRGADTAAEFARQHPKTVAAILGLGADVIGVNEIENDGYGSASAIAHLVDRLNAATAPGTYAYLDVDAATGQLNALGDDAIKVGLIYRPAGVTPVGATAVLNSPAFVLGGDAPPAPPLPQLRSRPSLAQAFETPDGARFIVDVNHFKSKGSPCDLPDAGDGQGNCNVVRTNAATALVGWLATDPTGTGDQDVLIMGDLNSYAREDPISVLTAAGYTNLVESFVTDPYSFVFDGQWGYLDHALASSSATDQVAGVVEWHINSDEPSVLDYNTDFKTANLQNVLYAPDRFRVSDHDPIVVGLDATSDRPTVDAGGPYLVEELGTVQLAATGSDPTGDALAYAWDLDGNGTFETAGQSVTFAAGSLQAPQTVIVSVRITDEHGQSSSDQATIDVIWDFRGFQPPLGAALDTARAGSAVPVKFSLTGDQGMDVLAGTPTVQRWDCTTLAPTGSPFAAASSEPFSYDPLTDTYKFVWKTHKGWAGTCATLTVALDDGQAYEVDIRFTN